MTSFVLETRRLALHRLTSDDAPFIHELLNEPSWIRFIGDRHIRTLDDARGYIAKGPVASYERFGFGLFRVTIKESGVPIGISGLMKRDALEDVDVGFAFLPRFWGHGYAHEAAAAVVKLAHDAFGMRRVIAIAMPENTASIRVLEKTGFVLESKVRLTAGEPELNLFALDLSNRPRAAAHGDAR